MPDFNKKKKPRIAFFCGADGETFLHDIYSLAADHFELYYFQTKTIEHKTIEQIYELMKYCDISWFEWCTELAVVASHLPKVCRNIIRLHRYEAFTGCPKLVKWENIDVLITVGNGFVRDKLNVDIPEIEDQTKITEIPSGINLEKFEFSERQKGKNIAFVGNLSMKKNPVLLLHCFEELLKIDPEYRLFFAGAFHDPILEQYMRYTISQRNLDKSIFFAGWQEDINAWLGDKHYIVCSSIVEGHPVGIMEGMARGLKPVLHDYPGSRQFFPAEFIFETPAEFCDLIISGAYEPSRYRRFIEKMYPLSLQLERINEVFNELGQKEFV